VAAQKGTRRGIVPNPAGKLPSGQQCFSRNNGTHADHAAGVSRGWPLRLSPDESWSQAWDSDILANGDVLTVAVNQRCQSKCLDSSWPKQ